MDQVSMPRWLLAVFIVGAAAVLIPFAPWIVMALWLAMLARRVERPILRLVKRRGLAATLTVLLLLGLVVPAAMLIGSIALDAYALVRELMQTEEWQSVLEQLARGDGTGNGTHLPSALTAEGITDLLMNQGGRAWELFQRVAGAAVHATIGALILVTGMYGALVDGKVWYAWFERHGPLTPHALRRLTNAFVETGRGLAIGIVGTGLIQSVIATISYLVIGVPQALALGLLTLMFSVVPAVGTAIVWAPVAAGLYLTGREGAALGLVIVGVAVIGTVDNLARPYLARKGHLALPTYVLLLAMFGGIELIGAWGLVIGPLVMRLAKEAMLLRSEARGADPTASDLATPDGP